MLTTIKIIPLLIIVVLSTANIDNNIASDNLTCPSSEIRNCNGSLPDACCSYWTVKFSIETKPVWFGLGNRFFPKWECTTGGDQPCTFSCDDEPETSIN